MKKSVHLALWLLVGAVAMIAATKVVMAQLPPPPSSPAPAPPPLITPVRPPMISPILP